MTLQDTVGPAEPGKMLSNWKTALDKGEDINSIQVEFNRSETFRRRLAKLLRAEFDTYAQKEMDISAPDFAVQAAFSLGAKKALQTIYRLIHADPNA